MSLRGEALTMDRRRLGGSHSDVLAGCRPARGVQPGVAGLSPSAFIDRSGSWPGGRATAPPMMAPTAVWIAPRTALDQACTVRKQRTHVLAPAASGASTSRYARRRSFSAAAGVTCHHISTRVRFAWCGQWCVTHQLSYSTVWPDKLADAPPPGDRVHACSARARRQ